MTVTFEDREAAYRLESTDSNNEVELAAVNESRCIFPHHLLTDEAPGREPAANPDVPAVVAAVLPFRSNGATEEKRRFTRVALRTQVIITTSQSSSYGTTADVSPGGCYVELTSPMPVGTEVEISAGSDQSPFRATGRVVTSHPMFGMGIAFHEQQPEIEQQLSCCASKDIDPSVQPAPRQLEEKCNCAHTEQLFSELLIWFAANPDLKRAKFFELVHNCSLRE